MYQYTVLKVIMVYLRYGLSSDILPNVYSDVLKLVLRESLITKRRGRFKGMTAKDKLDLHLYSRNP